MQKSAIVIEHKTESNCLRQKTGRLALYPDSMNTNEMKYMGKSSMNLIFPQNKNENV